MRYLGNKTRLIKKIEKFLIENNIQGEIFCDLFAGTSTVGDYFKNKHKIIANDFMYYSYQISRAKLLNNTIPEFKKFKNKYNQEPFSYFNNIEYKHKANYLVTNYFSSKAGRKFFSENNSIKIDGIRLEIEELYKKKIFNEKEYSFLLASLLESATKHANITGTYEAFLKHWDSRAIKNMKYVPLDLNITEKISKNEIHNCDANYIIRKIAGDILYLDPPYTITEYSSAYHVLETIAKYDYPEIAGITGRRKDNKKKSTFTRKKMALNSFEDIIRQASFKYIVISYSNQSIIPLIELENMLEKYSINNKIIKKVIPFREYKNIRTSKKAEKLFEVLYFIEKDLSVIKSPLNYSGSKDSLIPQIQKYLPGHITTFIDMMGGAFNVGVNITADKVIYNEYNTYVYDIIQMLLNKNKTDIISHIANQIQKFNLQKSNSETFREFRKQYNENQNPLDLFLLSMFCFQNQLRFNNSKKFNTPVGNCAYNSTIKERLLLFTPKTQNIELLNENYQNIDFSKYDKESLFYFDPPYFITNATYNDGKRGFNGWDSDQESKLLSYLSTLNEKGYKFMLSNIIEHKGKTNHLLKEWIESNEFKVINLESNGRKEILVINYDLSMGIRD